MRLIAQIFRKDIWHFYPEILISFALLATFAWAAPAQWSGFTGMDSRIYLAGFLRLLLPLAWLVLLSRLIHDEPLAGDRQFWVTRPIPWKVLLAAKTLFTVCFIGVPLLLMRLYLLHHAGLSIASSLGALVLSTSLLLLAFVLPFAALAVVTTSFARQTIALLVAVVYLIAVGFITGSISHWLFGNAITPPYLVGFLSTLAGLALVAVILLQYAQRRTRLGLVVLAALPLTLVALALVSPDKELVHSLYRETTTPLTQPFNFDRNPARQQSASGEPTVLNDRVMLQLPLTLSASAASTRVRTRGVSISVTDAGGFHWTSPYLEPNVSENQTQATLMIEIPAEIFARLRQQPVHLDLNVAEEKYASTPSQSVQINERGSFTAPQHGVCMSNDNGTGATCLYGVRNPLPIKLVTTVTDQPCAIESVGTQNEYSYFVGGDDRSLSLDFDPVVANRFTVTVPTASSSKPRAAYLCPGAFIHFTPTYIASRDRTDVSADGVVLGPYAWSKDRHSRKTFAPDTSD